MGRKKQKIKITIVNPEDLEQANINYTRTLFKIWWEMNFETELK